MLRWLVILGALLLAGCQHSPPKVQRITLGVMTMLPLFWSEGGAVANLGQDDQRAPLLRFLASVHDVRPLDVLRADTLAKINVLLLAQPRLLAPEELVTLDGWVRNGGRLILMADPELRWPSSLPLGDPRRAPPVTLLDPLLWHWGLELGAPSGATNVALGNENVPVVAAGAWRSRDPSCVVQTDALITQCTLGKGRALLVGDADLLYLPADAPSDAPIFLALLTVIESLRAKA